MVDDIHSNRTERGFGVRRRQTLDPLLKPILFDLMITTCGFVSMVAAVVLAVHGLSLN